jgi:hypothetical protein
MGDRLGAGPGVGAGTGALSLRVSGAGFKRSSAGLAGSAGSAGLSVVPGGGLDGWLFSFLGGADAGLASGSAAVGGAAAFAGAEAFPLALGEDSEATMI